MWLRLLGPTGPAPLPLEGLSLILQEAEWFWHVRTRITDKVQFLHLFMGFLSNDRRSGEVYVGSAISIAHFAHVCAQKAWTGLELGARWRVLYGSERRRYVDSAIPDALLDDILHRLAAYLYDVMNLLIFGDAPRQKSDKLTPEMLTQNIKVSYTPISLSWSTES